jgi:hypothetical protein
MPIPLILDKGTYRVTPKHDVQAGWRYFGFICPHCGTKIYVFDDPTNGTAIEPLATGPGKFSTSCRTCKIDQIIFESSSVIKLQADKTENTSRALPRAKPSGGRRQKLRNRYADAKATFGPNAIEQRPECAVIFSRCIATWSYIEEETALLLAVILKINTEPALAMFIAMQNTRTQIDVLSAAAKAVLNERDIELFQAIINIRKSFERDRNCLVHGLIGGSDLVVNGILWSDQKDQARHTATVWGTNFEQMETPYLDEIFVYEAGDLETIAQNMEWLHQFMGFFRGYVGSTNDAWRSERYLQLCAEPRVRAELDRMRLARKNTPEAPKE